MSKNDEAVMVVAGTSLAVSWAGVLVSMLAMEDGVPLVATERM